MNSPTRFKRLTLVAFLALQSLTLFVLNAVATEPTIAKVSQPLRTEILNQGYEAKDSLDDSFKKIASHLARECGGTGYHSSDMDLTAHAILKGFPAAIVEKYAEKEALKTCPRGVQALLQASTDLTKKKATARLYTDRHDEPKSADGWSWQMHQSASVGTIAQVLAEKCEPTDVAALGKLICGYNRGQKYSASELEKVQGLFDIKKMCPAFDFAKVPCPEGSAPKKKAHSK